MNRATVVSVLAFSSVLLGGVAVRAQELSVQGNSSAAHVFEAVDTATSGARTAVYGSSVQSRDSNGQTWGIGGYFAGGAAGVEGFGQLLSAYGTHYGGYFVASGAPQNYGVYARASGPGTDYAGYFVGDVFVSGTVTQASDLRLKTDVRDMPSGTLAQILRLKPKTYQFVNVDASGLQLPAGKQIGFVAQDVAAVFPELVRTVKTTDEHAGKQFDSVMTVDYVKVVPLLVKAVQEQQAQIDTLRRQLEVGDVPARGARARRTR